MLTFRTQSTGSARALCPAALCLHYFGKLPARTGVRVGSEYSLRPAACRTDFVPPGYCTPESLCAGLFFSASLQSNVVQVPEGGTELEYLAISFGIAGWGLWRIHHPRRTRIANCSKTS